MSGQGSDRFELPVEIADAETIVRVVVAPAHFDKKGRVKAGAFRPKTGESGISVIRQLMGDDFCKAKGVAIGHAAPEGYKGLLTLAAAAIRVAGSTVVDSRDGQYLGHADLDHGFASVRDEPATRHAFEKMTERCQALKDASRYHADPEPEVDGWQGPTLKIE